MHIFSRPRLILFSRAERPNRLRSSATGLDPFVVNSSGRSGQAYEITSLIIIPAYNLEPV